MAADLLTELRSYLVSAGIVRVPRVAGPLPPMWLSPRNGAPAPGEVPDTGTATEVGADVVVAAFRTAGVASDRYEGFKRIPYVDIHIRARTVPLAEAVERQLYFALHDKRGWDMGLIRVQESLQFRDLQSLGADNDGWRFVTEYSFEAFAEAL